MSATLYPNQHLIMLDQLNKMYDSGDEKVRILYKYRPCELHHIDCLRNDTLWFSTHCQLNDPFDCLVRFPTMITDDDVQDVRERLATAQPYRLDLSDGREVAEYIGESAELPPLVPLGLLAGQLENKRLLEHIRVLNPSSSSWVRHLIEMARDVAQQILHNVTIFCVSEPNNHQLMWAHYAASHTGFCTGYVCPVGIPNPQFIQKVQYVEAPPAITAWQLVDDPGSVYRDLTLTKPTEWSYEKEWRVTFGNMPGLIDNLLPIREIILGAKISTDDEMRVCDAVGARDVRIFRAVAKHTAGKFEIEIESA